MSVRVLQMELERIRQSDTEVRWQHEDDVDACSRCHVGFSLSKRKVRRQSGRPPLCRTD